MAWPITAVAAAACGKPAFASAGAAAMAPVLKSGPKCVSHASVGVTAKLTAIMQNCVDKSGSASLSSVWSHLLYADIAHLCSIFVEHGTTLIQQIDVPERMFSVVAMLYISFNSFRSTSASISSRMLNNSFELRRRQMSIQQKFVRQMSDTTRSFCVRSQHAHPRCRPRTKREVRIFVDECMAFSPASAKSSTKHKITSFFVLFVLEVCVDIFCRSINFPTSPAPKCPTWFVRRPARACAL